MPLALEDALDLAYATWADKGHPFVPTFNPADYDPAALAARLDALSAVECRCVISRVKAQFLRSVLP